MEVNKLKDKPPQVVVREKSLYSANTITANEINRYLPLIGSLSCSFSRGSGSIWYWPEKGAFILTNYHVIKDHLQNVFCDLFTSNNLLSNLFETNLFREDLIDIKEDYAFIAIDKERMWKGMPSGSSVKFLLNELPQDLAGTGFCPNKMPVGSPVMVAGYPKFSYPAQTVTNGVVSGYETYTDTSNYYVSAKVDSGNSGGLAFSKHNEKLCVLGVPTALSIGNFETQGIILNIHKINFP